MCGGGEYSGSQGHTEPSGFKGMNTVISPRFVQTVGNDILDLTTKKTISLNDTGVKIDVFEDRMKGWFLDQAEKLRQHPHSGFAILTIGAEYVEALQQYWEGQSSDPKLITGSTQFYVGSRAAFNRGMHRIFDNIGEDVFISCNFYDRVRCGLFHNCMTKSDVMISEFDNPITITGSKIYINPELFLEAIRKDFKKYIGSLRQAMQHNPNDEQLQNFITMWGK